MPVEMTDKRGANSDESSRTDTRSAGEVASVEHDTKSSPITPPSGRQSIAMVLQIGMMIAAALPSPGQTAPNT